MPLANIESIVLVFKRQCFAPFLLLFFLERKSMGMPTGQKTVLDFDIFWGVAKKILEFRNTPKGKIYLFADERWRVENFESKIWRYLNVTNPFPLSLWHICFHFYIILTSAKYGNCYWYRTRFLSFFENCYLLRSLPMQFLSCVIFSLNSISVWLWFKTWFFKLRDPNDFFIRDHRVSRHPGIQCGHVDRNLDIYKGSL